MLISLGRFYSGETIRIPYEARRLAAGISDIKITIWDDSLAKLVDAAAVTELESGIYYYDYAVPSTGNFLALIDSATNPSRVTGSFYVE